MNCSLRREFLPVFLVLAFLGTEAKNKSMLGLVLKVIQNNSVVPVSGI